MNRILKFRVWCQDFNKFEFFTLSELFGCDCPDWDIEKVQQFTGLLDQNYKEIFEGDIIALPLRKFHNGKRRLIMAVNFDDILNWRDDESPKEYYSGFEIIGNIFENPELLKQ